ncbi:MAG: hypothetical protein C4534_10700 [Gaiellales bacterium]|nr:MAG: hypothetical protein C4534_10700 [Gaiellales bacterium]
MTESKAGKGGQTVVIGLDGTPWSFLSKEMEEGNLPHLAGIFSRGAFNRMTTEIPTISSVAWASFMTGRNPGEHGIYGFTDRKPGTYDLYFPNYSHLKSEPLWETLGRKGKRCCVLNVPSTYPARPLNGVLVSGFVAPDLARATYPVEALEYLEKSGYRIDVDAAKGRESLDLLIDDLHETMERRRDAILHFWNQEAWDLFVAVFTGTDRLHHFMWRHYDEGDGVYSREFLHYYRRLDEIIGEFAAGLPEETSLFMLSDHGFCSIRSEVYLNYFLREMGYLSLREGRAVTIADMDPAGTRAYCMDPGRVYVNLQGREPGGTVPESAYDAVLDELTEALLGITDPETGERVVATVHRRDELFHGPLLESAPDLVAMPAQGYDIKGAIGRPKGLDRGHLTGMHTHDDAFWYASPGAGATVSHIREAAAVIAGQVS